MTQAVQLYDLDGNAVYFRRTGIKVLADTADSRNPKLRRVMLVFDDAAFFAVNMAKENRTLDQLAKEIWQDGYFVYDTINEDGFESSLEGRIYIPVSSVRYIGLKRKEENVMKVCVGTHTLTFFFDWADDLLKAFCDTQEN